MMKKVMVFIFIFTTTFAFSNAFNAELSLNMPIYSTSDYVKGNSDEIKDTSLAIGNLKLFYQIGNNSNIKVGVNTWTILFESISYPFIGITGDFNIIKFNLDVGGYINAYYGYVNGLYISNFPYVEASILRKFDGFNLGIGSILYKHSDINYSEVLTLQSYLLILF